MGKRFLLGFFLILGLALPASGVEAATAGEVLVGVNVPLSGPYSLQGKDQQKAYSLAEREINEQGGILGRKVRCLFENSRSDPEISVKNVEKMIDEGADMVTGGSSSGVAVAVSELCQRRGVVFLTTLTYSNDVTGEKAHRHTFRETYNAWMAAKGLSRYLNERFSGKRYFYVTADYNWGWTTRDSLKRFTGTEKAADVLVPLGEPLGSSHHRDALRKAEAEEAEVLVLVLFGRDMIAALRQAIDMGLKEKMQIVAPNLEMHMALGGNPPYTGGVVGAVPWYWRIPEIYGFEKGKAFVEAFRKEYGKPPGSGAATAYTNMMLYKWAAEKTGGFQAGPIIRALEGHRFIGLKDEQRIRSWDHQTVQSVFIVQGTGEDREDPYDVFRVVERYSGEDLAPSREENPATLEPLAGESRAPGLSPESEKAF